MSVIALTAAQVEPCFPDKAEIFTLVASEAITKGQTVYQTTAGTAAIATASQQFRGIALETVGAGAAVPVLKCGHVYGYTLTAVAYDALVYVGDTMGRLETAAGSTTVNGGRVMALADNDLTKVLYVDADWRRTWA